MLHFLRVRLAYNHYAIAHAWNAANTHAQGSGWARWSQKLTLSSKAIGWLFVIKFRANNLVIIQIKTKILNLICFRMDFSPSRIWWWGKHARLKKWWCCSLACISESILDEQHQNKLLSFIFVKAIFAENFPKYCHNICMFSCGDLGYLVVFDHMLISTQNKGVWLDLWISPVEGTASRNHRSPLECLRTEFVNKCSFMN